MERTGKLSARLSMGDAHAQNCVAIIPKKKSDLAPILLAVMSDQYRLDIASLADKLILPTGVYLQVQIDAAQWRSRAADLYPAGLPEPYSNDPTQWIFHGHPAGAAKGTELHVALARLAGFTWPGENDPSMRLSREARAWIERAGSLPAADLDGVLPLTAISGERSLADRLRDFLAACFRDSWSDQLARALVSDADELLDGKPARDLSIEAWLNRRAFRQHCRLFKDRPFLWHVWDSQSDGFSAFLYYHRASKANLQKLTYTVLGDWIQRRRSEGDDRRVELALILQTKLKLILEGDRPYDVFVRWKPLDEQPFGWEPDLDDGVRLNIRPWVTSGVLRDIPKIAWGVDRGTDVKPAPWYDLFGGKRNNDYHTTLAEKRALQGTTAA